MIPDHAPDIRKARGWSSIGGKVISDLFEDLLGSNDGQREATYLYKSLSESSSRPQPSKRQYSLFPQMAVVINL
jgi:hypothetical protein